LLNEKFQDEMNVVDPGSQNKTRHRRVPKIGLRILILI
jgi:hypothetical protein